MRNLFDSKQFVFKTVLFCWCVYAWFMNTLSILKVQYFQKKLTLFQKNFEPFQKNFGLFQKNFVPIQKNFVPIQKNFVPFQKILN